MDSHPPPRGLKDQELLEKTKELAAHERDRLVLLLEYLGEIDRRRLYADAGYPHLFAYCVQELRYSEGAAARRLRAARAMRNYLEVAASLREGSLSLSALASLTPHLTRENHAGLLARAQGKSRLELERLIAEIAPRHDIVDTIRHVALKPPDAVLGSRAPKPNGAPPGTDTLPARPGSEPSSASPAGSLPIDEALSQGAPDPRNPPAPEAAASLPPSGEAAAYLSACRVRFSFTAGEDFLQKVRRARELLRRKYPFGRLESVFGEAVECFLESRDPERKLACEEAGRPAQTHPRFPGSPAGARPSDTRPPQAPPPHETPDDPPNSRHIPKRVKDAVWARDEGRCQFKSADGRLCGERGWLEYDHVIPWALGGRSDDPGNIRLLCWAHNQLAARRAFGLPAK